MMVKHSTINGGGVGVGSVDGVGKCWCSIKRISGGAVVL